MGRGESMSGVCDGGKIVDIVRRLAVRVYCLVTERREEWILIKIMKQK